MTYLVRGLDNDGNETFYTGKAGNAWLTSNWRGAFTYSLNGARSRATNLNKMTEVHGIRFIAITRAAYISNEH